MKIIRLQVIISHVRIAADVLVRGLLIVTFLNALTSSQIRQSDNIFEQISNYVKAGFFNIYHNIYARKYNESKEVYICFIICITSTKLCRNQIHSCCKGA